MAMNNLTMRPRQSSVLYHPEAVSWKSRAVANGGTVSSGTMQAVSDFCTAIDDIGTIRSAFLRLNLVCGDNLAAALTPLYRGTSASGYQYGAAADINNGPYAPENYTEATGLTGNGTSKFVDTSVHLGDLVAIGADWDDVHCSAYIRSIQDYNPVFGGADDDGVENNQALLLYTDSFQTGDANLTHFVTCSATLGNGLHLGVFIAVDNGQYCVAGSQGTASVTNTGGAAFVDTTQLYFGGAWSSRSVGNYYTSSPLAAYSIGKANGTDMSTNNGRIAFFNAMQAFQTALGRNV